MSYEIIEGDCVEELKKLKENSVDAVVTDPPYGLEFMGKEWDSFKTGRSTKYSKGGNLDKEQIDARKGKGGAGPSYINRPAKRCANCGKQAWSGSPCQCDKPRWQIDNSPLHAFQAWTEEWAVEAYRVLKPGGHLLAFGGSRTYHRLASAVEDAGFEIRDQIMWLYGSGFPKSLNVGKAIDKQRHDKKEIYQVTAWIREARDKAGISNKTIDEAFDANGMGRHWTDVPPNGKQPAVPTLDQVPKLLEVLGVDPDDVPEDIARLIFELNGPKGQPGENWFKREVVGKETKARSITGKSALPSLGGETQYETWQLTAPATEQAAQWEGWGTALKPAHEPIVVARKPLIGTVAANVLEHGTGAINVDGCRVGTAEDMNPRDFDDTKRKSPKFSGVLREGGAKTRNNTGQIPNGRWPANIILDEEAGEQLGEPSKFFYQAKASKKERNAGTDKNNHPTVKPIELMRYLCRLVTPPGGTVLDPFLGSGTTGCAVAVENNENGTDWNFIGIEREADYLPIAMARIEHWTT